ncbi:MAG: lactate racemase domain-containing protein, partial [Syntrophales bacterium]|nr:lactate racemase domain-containing protein [Syntrophales bacterium]
ESEVQEALGKEILAKIPFTQQDSRSENLVPIGRLKAGAEVRINPLVLEADFRIGIGCIVPHPFAGFGGGPKIIMPGVANFDAIREHHMTYLTDPLARAGRLDGNPCFEEILPVARKANLHFIVNTVYNGREAVKAVVSGDFDKALRQGAALTRREIEVKIDQEADVTLASTFPYDEGPQIIKPLGPAAAMTRRGGTVVLLASLRNGKLPDLLLKAFDRIFDLSKGDPESFVYRHVRERRPFVPEISMDFNCALGLTLLYLTRVKVILVSRDVTREDTSRLGFDYAASLEEAMERVSQDQPVAQVNIIPAGGLILPT